VPQTAAASDAYLVVSAVVGKTTTVAVSPGTQLVPAFFTAQPLSATVAGPGAANTPTSLEGLITKGFVALAIPTASVVPANDTGITSNGSALGADLVAAGGYIQAGDHIDIIVHSGVASGGARYSFQDVPVLRVGSAGSTAGGGLLIVEVPRNQAEILTQLTVGPTQPFVIKYVLRPQAEWGKVAPDNSSYSPNYENATGPALPVPQDSVVTPQTLSTLFGG
jgi:hypothetical protein